MLGRTRAEDEAAVVLRVNVEVALPPALRVMVVGFRLQVGALCALVGEADKEQARFMVPV